MRYFTGPLVPAEEATYDPETGEELTPATPNTVGVGTATVVAYDVPPGCRVFYTYDVDGVTPLEGANAVLIKGEQLVPQEGWTERSPEMAQSLFPEAF